MFDENNMVALSDGSDVFWDDVDGSIYRYDKDGKPLEYWFIGTEKYENVKQIYFPNHIMPPGDEE